MVYNRFKSRVRTNRSSLLESRGGSMRRMGRSARSRLLRESRFSPSRRSRRRFVNEGFGDQFDGKYSQVFEAINEELVYWLDTHYPDYPQNMIDVDTDRITIRYMVEDDEGYKYTGHFASQVQDALEDIVGQVWDPQDGEDDGAFVEVDIDKDNEYVICAMWS